MAGGRRKAKITWVKMGPAPHFATCDRCGGHEQPPKLPEEIDAVLAYLDYLILRHEHCAEPDRALEGAKR
jgi:hypothetical protein